ncbi:MAG TPA: cytochrome c biogenesis protein CcdA [Thermoanaerobaculia bacterium]|nr:cytochrome c biogenesis protein CcdA [Thermoanaerobaculia bacterium]
MPPQEARPRLATLFLWMGLAVAAAGRAAAGPAPAPSELLKIQALLVPGPGGNAGTLRLDARLATGWHVNSHHPSEDYLIATAIRLDPAAGVEAQEPRYPDGKLKKFAFADQPLSVYQDHFSVEIPVSWSGAPPAALAGTVDFQACNDTQCLAPASVRFQTGGLEGGTPLTGGAVPLSQAPTQPPATSPTAGASQDFERLLASRGLAIALLFVFGSGLALNLTPCVYPIIPLTVSFFGGQAQSGNRRVLGLAALYVLGMATMYSALGVAAALSGKLFGVALQSPWVLGAVAGMLVLLALSMFGFYDIRMPSSWMQKAGARAGFAGAYAMGLLVGVVAAPCIGPVVLALLAFVAARQDAAFGLLIFFVLSLGLGLPYLFLGAFSGSISRLPRAGQWMDGVKTIFGWVLLAMAGYFLRTVVPAPTGNWLLPSALLAGAVALALRAPALPRAFRWTAAALFLVVAIFFTPRQIPASAQPDWRPYASAEVERAGRPTVIDFSASWCVPCLELDQKTFADPRVREALAGRALFKADLTRSGSPDAVALSRKYGILGVPTIIFLDASGKEHADLRLVGFEGPDEFLERLSKAP